MTTYRREPPRTPAQRPPLHWAARMSAGTVDTLYIDCRLWRESCACGAPVGLAGSLCPACKAVIDNLCKHVATLVQSVRCLSCNDPCAAVLCDACAESGETHG